MHRYLFALLVVWAAVFYLSLIACIVVGVVFIYFTGGAGPAD